MLYCKAYLKHITIHCVHKSPANTLCELNEIFNLKQAVHSATKLLKELT